MMAERLDWARQRTGHLGVGSGLAALIQHTQEPAL